MAIPNDQAITSLEALMSTVETDSQSYCWFSFLILQEPIRKRLSQADGILQAYRDLDKILFKQKIVYVLLWVVLEAYLLSGPRFFIGAGAALLAAGVHLHYRRKRSVLKICSCLFSQDFERLIFSKKTIYQIGELYGQEYGILSLVDAIAFSDRISWAVFICAIFFACFIYPLNPIYICLFIIFSVQGIRIAVNTPYVYRHIK